MPSSVCIRIAGAVLLAMVLSPSARADRNVRLRGHINPFPGIPFRYGDVWGEGHFAYLASYQGYGIMIIDISDPAVPVLVGFYNPPEGGRFQDVVVINGIGYFATESFGSGTTGVHVVDVRNPAHPVLLSQITTANNGHQWVHELFVTEGILYEADSRTPTVKAFDVSNPAAPIFIRDIVTTDPFFIHAITAVNGRLYTSGWGGHTDIYDVRQIRTMSPVLLGTVESGDRSHSSWVSSDGRLLVSAREAVSGDVRLFDISNPAQPVLRSTITGQGLGINALSPHNPYLVGNLLFVSWYQAGLQVLDVSNPSAPVYVGSFDTYDEPAGAITGFAGNWGAFPFLGLDRVLLSDMDGGLFIVDATDATPLPRTVSAANYSPDSVAARSIVSAFGSNLAKTTLAADTIPLPTLLGGAAVRVVDSRGIERLAPLYFVSPTQINYQIPDGTADGPASVTVTASDGHTATGVTIVTSVAPAIFTLSQNGQGEAAAIDAFSGRSGPFSATAPNGMPNIIALFATGLGADATDVDGNFGGDVEVTIDGIAASSLYAGRAPGYTGLNQMNILLPVGISSMTHSLVVTRHGVASNIVTIAIK